MKLKFKIQQYQTDAVESVINVFKGQPNQANLEYRMDKGKLYVVDSKKHDIKFVQTNVFADSDDAGNSLGYKNNRLAMDKVALFDNIRQIQTDNNIHQDEELCQKLGACQLDVEMETGTGKTYVYIKTMFELNKQYGWTKFIVVVPSIAIREGVKKSFDITVDHFMEQYGKKARYFIYDSSSLNDIDTFLQSNDISVMIINTQAFNTMKEGAKNKAARIINSERDEFGSRKPIAVLAANNPIIILDEPQKMGGAATQTALKAFNPLFTLNYSATHAKQHNLIYVLDALDAYNKRLVKKIEVKGVDVKNLRGTDKYLYLESIIISPKNPPRAKVELEVKHQSGTKREFRTLDVSDNLYYISGEMEQYKGFVVSEIDPITGVVTFTNGDTIRKGDVTGDVTEDDKRRVQIRETIISHFEKEQELFKMGIKTLSLFFIDEVAKYRQYDEDGNELLGEYGKIFEQEYLSVLNEHRTLFDPAYTAYLDSTDVHDVHKGYFSIDKKGHSVNSSVKRGSDMSDDISAYDLILKNKERLLSFEEPTRFIFSHSALREGWDNPNVFTLCTLKAGGSDIAKKQEIGRGLRLPVDNTGNRCIDHRINELTVIANDYYDHFASALQKDFNDNMHFVKDEVTADILIETLKSAGVPEEKISPKLVDTFKEELVSAGVMNTDNVLKGSSQQITKTLDNMVFVDDALNEHAQLIKQQFKELMIQKGTRKIEITNGDNAPYDNGVRAYVTQGEFEKIYLGLRKNLMQRSIYRFKIDKDKFIDDCIFQINQSLLFKKAKNEYKVETGRAKFNTSQMFIMEELTYGDKELEVEISSDPKSDFEIANFIMYHTMLPRLAIFKILQGVTKRELLNNQDILDEVTQLIKGILNDTKASNITSYEVINGYELDERNIFELDTITESDFEQEWRVFKAKSDRSSAMNEYYKLDSEGESKFAHKLENNENVLLFTKLKKGGFVIDTPYGNYSPDWAVVCRKEALKDPSIGIYFIVETKAGKKWADLTDVEKNKIHCGELHFKAVSDDTKFDWVNGYEDFVNKFGVADSNKEDL